VLLPGLAVAHCRACDLLSGCHFWPTRFAIALLLPQRSAVANAIKLDNEAALNMDKLYKSQPMQVGPFAQVLIGHAQGPKLTLKWAGEAISRVSAISKKQVTPAMLPSTLGRIAAYAIRASMVTDIADKPWDLLVKNIASGERPLEVLRTAHSFDPCLACAIHTFDPDGREVISVS